MPPEPDRIHPTACFSRRPAIGLRLSFVRLYSMTIPSIGAGSFNFVGRAVDAFGMASDSLPIRMVAMLQVKRRGFRLQTDCTILLDVEAPQGS